MTDNKQNAAKREVTTLEYDTPAQKKLLKKIIRQQHDSFSERLKEKFRKKNLVKLNTH